MAPRKKFAAKKAEAKKVADEMEAVAELVALEAKEEAEELAEAVEEKKEKVKRTRKAVKAAEAKAVTAVQEKVETKRAKRVAKTEAKAAQYRSFIQYAGDEIITDELFEKAVAAFKAEHKRTAIEKLNLYIKPEDRAAYYVVNEKFTGKIDF